MDFQFDTMAELENSLSDFHEELYHLEERYLKRFGVYPTMPDLSRDTVTFYVERIHQCLARDLMMEDLDQA